MVITVLTLNQRLSSTKPEYKDNRYIWIDKITNTSNKIYSLKKIKNQYKDFHTLLNKELKEVLDTYLNSFNIKKYKSRSNYYQKIKQNCSYFFQNICDVKEKTRYIQRFNVIIISK